MLVIALALCAVGQQSWATRRDVASDCKGDGAGKSCKQEAGRHSFVRSYDLKLVTTDERFAKEVKEAFGGASVDILMNQCYGGGFLTYVDQIGKPYTITTSTAWQMTSLFDWQPRDGKPLNFLEDFTRAWRKDAQLNPKRGLFDRFQLAANAGITSAKIPRDRYTPPGWKDSDGKDWIERPQYQSPDNPPGGANDSRPLLAPGKGNRYAILVQWSKPGSVDPLADRMAVRIARLKYTLKVVMKVSVDNIVVLYGNERARTVLGSFENIGGDGDDPNKEDLGSFAVDGPNTSENWIRALKGQLFGPGGKGITYGPDDQLFIYFTGHGENEKEADLPTVDVGGLNYQIQLEDGFDTGSSSDPDGPGGLTDPDGTDLLQISTTTKVTSSTVELSVDGAPFGPLTGMLVEDPTAIYDLGDFVKGKTYTYQVRVPHSLLASDPQTATIAISNVSDLGLVAAFTFEGGDQGYIAVINGQ